MKLEEGTFRTPCIPDPVCVGFVSFSVFCVLQSCQFLFRFRAVMFNCLVSVFVRNTIGHRAKEQKFSYIESQGKNDLEWFAAQFCIVGLASVKLQLGYVEHYPVRIQHPANKKRAGPRVILFETYSYFEKGCWRNVHPTIPKGNMGSDQYPVPDTVAVEPTFVASF